MELTPLLPSPVGLPASSEGDLQQSRSDAASDFDSFLRLLTAQLENQDPLEPLDSTQFVAQLASFSTVEQLVSANERLDALAIQSNLGDIASFASWIGREVAAADGNFRANGDPRSFPVPPLDGADSIEAVVLSASGQVLRRLDVTEFSGGRAVWDGLDAAGNARTGSQVRVEMTYFNEGVVLDNRTAEVMRRVTGIRGTESGIVLDLADGVSIAPDAVSRLEEAPAIAG